MLLGAWLRRNISLLGIKTKTKNILPLIFITGIFYMFLKLFRRSGVEVLGFIHIGIGLLTICLAMEIILWGAAYEDKLKDFFEKHPKMSLIVKNLSAITLAVYLFMGLDDRIIMQTVKEYLSFPLSYIINMAISLVGAYVITTIDKKLHALKK